MRPTPATLTAATVQEGYLQIATTTGRMRVRLEAVVIRGDALKIHRVDVERRSITRANYAHEVTIVYVRGTAVGTYCHLTAADVTRLVALGVDAEEQPRKARVASWRRSIIDTRDRGAAAGHICNWLGVAASYEDDGPTRPTLIHLPTGFDITPRSGRLRRASAAELKGIAARLLAEAPSLEGWDGGAEIPERELVAAILSGEPAPAAVEQPAAEAPAAEVAAEVTAPVAVAPDLGAPDLEALQTCAVTPDLRGLEVLDALDRQHLAAWMERYCGAEGEDDGRDAIRAEYLAAIASALVEWPTAVADGASWPQLLDYGRVYLADGASRLGGGQSHGVAAAAAAGDAGSGRGGVHPSTSARCGRPRRDDGDDGQPCARVPLQTCDTTPDLTPAAQRLMRDVLAVSSGTLAGLVRRACGDTVDARRYDVVEAMQSQWYAATLERVTTGELPASATWQQAWEAFAATLAPSPVPPPSAPATAALSADDGTADDEFDADAAVCPCGGSGAVPAVYPEPDDYVPCPYHGSTPDLPPTTDASAPDLRRDDRRRPVVVATFDCGGVAVPAVRVARVRDAYGAVCRDCAHHVDESGHLNLPWRWQQSRALHERATGHRMDLYRLEWPERPPEPAAPVEAAPPPIRCVTLPQRHKWPTNGPPAPRRASRPHATPARGSWRHGPPAPRRGTVSPRCVVSVAAGHGSRPPPALIGHSRLGRHRD